MAHGNKAPHTGKAMLPAVIEPAGALALPDDVLDLVSGYQRASKAAATVRAYKADAAAFTAWCAGMGVPSLPATPSTVAGFLSAGARDGLASSTLGRRLAAISYAHKLAGLDDPAAHETVRAAMKGIRRWPDVSVTQKTAATGIRPVPRQRRFGPVMPSRCRFRLTEFPNTRI